MEMSKFNATSDQEQFLQSKKVVSIESLVSDIGGDLFTVGSQTAGNLITPPVELTGNHMFVILYIKGSAFCLQVGVADENVASFSGAPNNDFVPQTINNFISGANVSNVLIMRFKLN